MCVKQTLSWFLVFLILFSAVSMIRGFAEDNESWENPYVDVTQDMWSYQYITELNRVDALSDSENFYPEKEENRGNFISMLYRMDQNVFSEKKDRAKKTQGKSAPDFTDVEKGTELYEAVKWAYQHELVGGTTETTFSPEAVVTREQACTILARFAAIEGIGLIQIIEPEQFRDSLRISEYARSGVTACQIAGVVKGYSNGFFSPADTMTRQECAAAAYRVMSADQAVPPEGRSLVDLTPGAYDALYKEYQDLAFVSVVEEGPEAPLTYFDKTVFIGDSVSLTLESYCNTSQALGGAQFLCAGSMSPTNMLTGQILPEYPKGSGKKPPIEDSVAASGAEIVYIMLGIDNIGYTGIDRGMEDMNKIIDKILSKSPDVKIVMQSVTPMADASSVKSNKLNNEVINNFNAKIQEVCQQKKWYYLDVSEVFKDGNGNLKKEYCSDYGKMGLHFNFEGAKVWVEYLKTHVPPELQ